MSSILTNRYVHESGSATLSPTYHEVQALRDQVDQLVLNNVSKLFDTIYHPRLEGYMRMVFNPKWGAGTTMMNRLQSHVDLMLRMYPTTSDATAVREAVVRYARTRLRTSDILLAIRHDTIGKR